MKPNGDKFLGMIMPGSLQPFLQSWRNKHLQGLPHRGLQSPVVKRSDHYLPFVVHQICRTWCRRELKKVLVLLTSPPLHQKNDEIYQGQDVIEVLVLSPF
jgi:hypothetical protein